MFRPGYVNSYLNSNEERSSHGKVVFLWKGLGLSLTIHNVFQSLHTAGELTSEHPEYLVVVQPEQRLSPAFFASTNPHSPLWTSFLVSASLNVIQEITCSHSPLLRLHYCLGRLPSTYLAFQITLTSLTVAHAKLSLLEFHSSLHKSCFQNELTIRPRSVSFVAVAAPAYFWATP